MLADWERPADDPIQLPDAELERLEHVFRTTTEAKLRHRVQIILMAYRGRRHPDIARDTGTSQRSVQRWLNTYLERGLDGLRPRKAPGAVPKLTDDLAPTLKQWVIDGPAKQAESREELAELKKGPRRMNLCS